MVGTAKEQQDGSKWFIGALVVAILFTAFLMKVDNHLSTSDSEKVLGREILRLRTAQTTLDSRVSDQRQIN